MRQFDVIIYGSYGYTGRLIVAECLKSERTILLAGRDENRLRHHAEETALPFKVVSLDDTGSLDAMLSSARLVIHCAGPFKHTSRKVAESCLRTGTHYTDITGEIEVFESLTTYHNAAVAKGIVIMPGIGFDVVPTDCLAALLHRRHPTATHLQLAFAMSGGGVSRGTARTMVEGLGYGSVVREAGKLRPIALGSRVKSIDFGSFRSNAICIPWGDVATAYRSTGIPNIEVYSAVPDRVVTLARLSGWFGPLLRARWMKHLLRKRVDNRPSGPSVAILERGKSYIWGKAWDENRSVEARLETVNGYKLTAQTAALISAQILLDVRPGFFTPAEYFGEALILRVDGSRFVEA